MRLTTRALVAPMTFMMTQQKAHTICNPKLIAIFESLGKKIKGPVRLQGCETLSFHWIRENSSGRGYNCEAKLSREDF